MSNQYIFLAIPVIFVFVGCGLIWFGLRSRKMARASRNWPAAPGQIISSHVGSYRSRDSKGFTKTTYQAEVEYEYSVDGQILHGNRVQFGLAGGSNGAALQAIVNRYPAGASVSVFYNPDKPAHCTLEQTAAGSVVVLFIIGAAFLTIAPCVGSCVLFGTLSPGIDPAFLESLEQNASTVRYVNDATKLSPSHQAHYVDFSFRYPKSWKLDPAAGQEGDSNFIKVQRAVDAADGPHTQENIAFGSFWFEDDQSSEQVAAAEMISQLEPQFEQGFPNFHKESEGTMKFGFYDGYGMNFTASIPVPGSTTAVAVWGRVIVLPPSVTGQINGVSIVMLATSEAPEVHGLEDLGVKGELPTIIESFELGKQKL